MVEVTKKDRETPTSMIRRFSRRMQQSGTLLRSRKLRFFRRRPSRTQRRDAAMRRIEKQRDYERQAKLGKLEDDMR